jgi:tripartite ATP-independent transporter DctM subunit
MDPITLGLLGMGGIFVLIALHVPIGIAMGLAGLVGVGSLIGWEPAISLFGTEPSDKISSEGLAVLALFLLMGSFAGLAGLAKDMYRLFYAFLGHYPGGLAMATIGGCAGFGSVCGSSVATAATFARVALPEMLDRKYQPALAGGCIAAGGTLGMIIPPSLVMIIYGILTEEFVIALFAAAIIPGLISVVFYFITISAVVRLNPDAGPAGPRMPWRERLQVARECWGIVFLAIVVSGGIYAGVFTVAEAASVGACIAFFFAVARGKVNRDSFLFCLRETAGNTGMIYVIIMGASIFSYFVTLSHLPEATVSLIQSLGLPPLGVIFLFLLMYLILGSVFDTVAAMVITLPFVFPVIIDLGYDPIWWGVMNVVAMEIGMITPPIGMNVFVLHGVAKDLPLKTIFSGILPFFCADVMRLALITFFPAIVLWLPKTWGLM